AGTPEDGRKPAGSAHGAAGLEAVAVTGAAEYAAEPSGRGPGITTRGIARPGRRRARRLRCGQVSFDLRLVRRRPHRQIGAERRPGQLAVNAGDPEGT